MEDASENTVIKMVWEWFREFGKPKTIITDNGTQFNGSEFKKLLKEEGVRSVCIPIYHPSSNGISERVNSTVAEILRIYKDKDIKEIVYLINRRLNINYKRSIGASPYQVAYGYSHFDPEIKISEVQPRRKAKRATNYPHKKIRVDQTVYIKVFNAGKLDKQYEGPYVVAEVGPKGNWIKVKGNSNWIHLKDVK